MKKSITIELRPEDAEPILRQAAKDAAYYGTLLDCVTRRTVGTPGFGDNSYEARRDHWRAKFVSAKRTIEAFGVEHKTLPEVEVIGTHVPYKVLKSHIVTAGGIKFRHVDKSRPDPKNARPMLKGDKLVKGSWAVADEVVARWKEAICEPAEDDKPGALERGCDAYLVACGLGG